MTRLAIFLPIFIFCHQAIAIEDISSQSTYGGIGLIQTPTARFSEDGEFLFGISSEEPYNRLYSKMQFFPWMEAVLRYTEGQYLAYNPGSKQTWKDKGLDLKFRLLEETNSTPALAIGLLDLGGTGAYSSEYIVSNKRIGNVDLSLGLGWGRLGGKSHISNPIGWFDDDRNTRGGYKPRGGTISLDRFFSGKYASFFGGIEYFPTSNLSIKIEYDSSDYSSVLGKETVFNEEGNIFEIDSRVNYGINYRINLSQRDKADLSIGFVRGNTVYANMAVHSNLNFKGTPRVTIGPERIRNSNLPAQSYKELNNKWKNFLTNRIIKEMANAGFVTHKVIYKDNELAAEISQSRFLETTKYLDLASKILANNALQNIDTLTVINIDQGIETMRSSVKREQLKSAALKGPLPEEIFEFNNYLGSLDEAIVKNNEYLYPNFFWEIKPHMRGTLQHQERFYFWQLEALIHTEYSIKQGMYFTTDIGIDITNNFDKYTYHIPDGELYHVRQNRRLYLTEGTTGIRRMALDYLFDLNPNIKAKMSLGYLEWMFGGVGGEILYMPDNKRWALGMDAYWVKQRDFDQRLGFKDYDTFTGFISYYQDLPFYDMRLQISAGRFLAEDVGAHIDISRRFKTGARVGGIVALTDCDSACVGEGSFNKWIYFELPMDLFYTQSTTRAKTGYSWSPLTKDAAAKIENVRLYNVMMSANDEIDSLRLKPWSLKKIASGFGFKPKERI